MASWTLGAARSRWCKSIQSSSNEGSYNASFARAPEQPVEQVVGEVLKALRGQDQS